ncbi:hypothetical protein HDU98_008203 [Podochytrium sp. JEL0797]|nr:hypothetical protein HDU98_008203 [Podochytrium sp. JEL0797]
MLVDFLVTAKSEGGCGIAVDAEKGPVKDLVVLQDADWQKSWLALWSKKALLDTNTDFDIVQQHLGEELAFYFAFLNFFLLALIPIAIVGLICHKFVRPFSTFYAIALSIWSIVFLTAWKRQQFLLADSWNSQNAQKLNKRHDFVPDHTIRDPATGLSIPTYTFWKRWIVHAGMTVPLVLAFIVLVVFFSAVILILQIFFTQVYNGPYKQVLSMSPVLLQVLTLPHIAAVYHRLSLRTTRLENSESTDDHSASLARKSFLVSFLLTHLSLFLVAACYIPVSDRLLPWLSACGVPVGGDVQILNLLGPESLKGRVVYFCVTGQVVGQLTEVGIPTLMAWWNSRAIAKKEEESGELKMGGVASGKEGEKNSPLVVSGKEEVGEEEGLRVRIRQALALPRYEIYEDYAELANQFALVCLFSGAWTLAPVCFVVNNVMELRTDAFKICTDFRRPIPYRTSSIEPWLEIFSVLSLLGTCTTFLLTSLYQNWDPTIPASQQTLPHAVFFLILVFSVHLAHKGLSWCVEQGFVAMYGDVKGLSGAARERRVREWERKQEMLRLMRKEEDEEGGVEAKVDLVMGIVGGVFSESKKEV